MEKIRKYFTFFKITFINDLAYVSNYIGQFFTFALFMFVYSFVWRAIYSGKTVIEGYSFEMVMWYFMFTETVMMSKYPFYSDMAEEIKSGDIAYSLNKPYSYILFNFSKYISTSVIRMFLNTVFGSFIILIITGSFPVKLSGFLFGFISAFFGLVLNFFFFFLLGLTAFWFEDNSSFAFIYGKFLFTVGGLFMPVEFFPAFVRNITDYMPFKYIIYVPARSYIEGFGTFIDFFPVQFLNILIYGILVYILYSFAVKRLNVNGG